MSNLPQVADVEVLKAEASKVSHEWVTFILLRHDVGLPLIARHLTHADHIQGKIRWNCGESGQVFRDLPGQVEAHLNSLPSREGFLCPWLNSLSDLEFSREWKKLRRAAGVNVSLHRLSSRYCASHQSEISREYYEADMGDTDPTEEAIERLKKAGKQLNPEWVILIVLVHDGGIVVRLARHRKQTDIHGEDIHLSGGSVRYPYWRSLPRSSLREIRKLAGSSPYLCPWLHSLSWNQLIEEWRKVENLAQVRVSFRGLRAAYVKKRAAVIAEDRLRAQNRAVVQDDTIRALIRAGARIHSDWETFLMLTHRVGLSPSLARRQKRSNLIGDELICQPRRRAFPYKRDVPEGVRKHLSSLKHQGDYFCPWLNSLTSSQFRNEWCRLLKHAHRVVRLSDLARGYRAAHKDQIRFKKAMAILEGLAAASILERWLAIEDLKNLRLNAQTWVRLPAKAGQTGRKKTREQLLAGIPQVAEDAQHVSRAHASLLDSLVKGAGALQMAEQQGTGVPADALADGGHAPNDGKTSSA